MKGALNVKNAHILIINLKRELRMREWKNNEIEYLKKNYQDKLDYKIANTLARSSYSIKLKARKLGLKKSINFWKRKHKRTSERMKKNNPMCNPKILQKKIKTSNKNFVKNQKKFKKQPL